MRTTVVMGALLLAMSLVGIIVTVKPERPHTEVEFTDAVAGATAAADFDVVAPKALPDDWTATSVRFGPDAWHLGVLTSADKYVGLEQSTGSIEDIVTEFAPDSRSRGSAHIAGRTWQVRTESDGDRVYVRDVGETAVLVIGSATRAELERYVSSLSGRPAA